MDWFERLTGFTGLACEALAAGQITGTSLADRSNHSRAAGGSGTHRSCG